MNWEKGTAVEEKIKFMKTLRCHVERGESICRLEVNICSMLNQEADHFLLTSYNQRWLVAYKWVIEAHMKRNTAQKAILRNINIPVSCLPFTTSKVAIFPFALFQFYSWFIVISSGRWEKAKKMSLTYLNWLCEWQHFLFWWWHRH